MLSAIWQDGRNHAHHRFLAIKHRSKWKLLQKHVSLTFPHIHSKILRVAAVSYEHDDGRRGHGLH